MSNIIDKGNERGQRRGREDKDEEEGAAGVKVVVEDEKKKKKKKGRTQTKRGVQLLDLVFKLALSGKDIGYPAHKSVRGY